MCRQYADFQSKYIDQHHPQEKSGNGGQKDRNQRAERIREGILFDLSLIHILAAKKNITEADCDSFLFYADEQTGMTGGFTRENDMFTLLDKPGFGLDISF